MTNMEIKVLVADDELPARGELKYQLASIAARKCYRRMCQRERSYFFS